MHHYDLIPLSVQPSPSALRTGCKYLSETTVHGCLQFLRQFGIPVEDGPWAKPHTQNSLQVSPLTQNERDWIRRHISKALRGPSCVCALDALVPSSMRRVLVRAMQDADATNDAKQYVRIVDDVLDALQVMECLYTPESLTFPTSYHAPRSNRKCRRGCSPSVRRRSKSRPSSS